MSTAVAIIGCGLIGRKRADALKGRADVVAVFDPDRARADDLAHHIGGIARSATSVVDALDSAAGGLAIVATTHDALAATAIAAAGAGCHVLVEKPGARNADEAAAIAAAAAAAGVVCRVGFNHRFHPSLLEARRLLDGRYGEPLLVRGRYGHGGRPGYESEWRADKVRSGGGELLDQGVHLLDLTRFLTGELELRYASLPTLYWPMEVEDNAFLHARLSSGGDAWLHASWTEWKNLFSLEIACRAAKIEISGLGGSYGPERLTVYEMPPEMGPPLVTTTEWPPGDGSWAAEIDDVLGAVAGRRAVGASIDDCVATLTLVDKAYDA